MNHINGPYELYDKSYVAYDMSQKLSCPNRSSSGLKDRIIFQKYSLCVSLCPSLEPQGLSFVRIRRKFQSFLWVIVRWNIWCPIKRNQTLEHQNRNEL